MNDAKVELDTTPTGAFGLPRWQYDIRAAAACLEAEPQLAPSYRKFVADMLGRHEQFIEAALEQSDAEREQLTAEEAELAKREMRNALGPSPGSYFPPDPPERLSSHPGNEGEVRKGQLTRARARGTPAGRV